MHRPVQRGRLSVVTEVEQQSSRSQIDAPPQSQIAEPPSRRRRLIDPWIASALAITAVALGLRLAGLNFGLPYHYHWDEPTIVNRVIRMGGGDLNPHFFYYPTLLMYLLLAVQGALYGFGRVLHIYPSADAFAVAYLTDSTAQYLAGRALVACLGAASIFLTFVVGRRFVSAPPALIGALLLAVSPVHIGSSHFVTNDVPMAFFVLLTYVSLWNVYKRGQVRDYVLSGIGVGLGTSTKYLPVVLLISVAMAHVFRLRNQTGSWRSTARGWPWLLLAGGVAFAAFAVTSPYVLLDWRSALHDYAVQGSLSSAAGCRDCPPNFGIYLSQTLPWAIGWPAYLLALGGLASLVVVRGETRLRGMLLASFPVILFLLVGSERQPWPRWLVPVAPFASLAAGAVVWWALGRLPRGRPSWAVPALVSAITAVLVLPPAFASTRFDLALLRSDPRTQANAWFVSSVPEGTTIAVQPMLDRYFFTVQLPTDTQLAAVEAWVPPSKPDAREAVSERYHRQPIYHEASFTYDVAALRAQAVRYVVLSSAHYHGIDPATEDRFYAQLNGSGNVVARFSPPVDLPDAAEYPVSMPTITVYELPPGR